MRRAWILFVAMTLATGAGCARRATQETAPKALRMQETLAGEIRARISMRVLRDAPNRGRLARVRREGILEVALPPPEMPFQVRDAGRNLLFGFNVDLAEEIAGALLVKTNVRVLTDKEIERATAECASGKFDLVFPRQGAEVKPPARALPYFFTGADRPWRTLCAAGPDDSLRRAVENVLSYLNESGGFMQMYASHFAARPRAKAVH